MARDDWTCPSCQANVFASELDFVQAGLLPRTRRPEQRPITQITSPPADHITTAAPLDGEGRGALSPDALP
eukprot:CAMPEP_0174698544 /NCGR_PEP_ID=MMETSP1094-20130205/4115_1 /TAXON_ID=156173 /ORGANISM="Chrysochromulina brevifilum, Strain UTEX LB 985" /LENGTH=70 /DNA_ID=CAMNT_0015895737 /DNA_START=336 /DNA_END=548 /DNA_ORIENTATION=+